MGGHYVDPALDAANRERQRLVAHGARLGDSSTEIATAAGVTRQRVCQIIGELVVLDSAGKSHFNALMHRNPAVTFYAFDMPWSTGSDQRPHPLSSRKNAMRGMFGGGVNGMVIGDHVVGAGVALFTEICRRDCEGIVGKPLKSPYGLVRGRAPWVKVLNPAYTQSVDGRRRSIAGGERWE